MIQQEYKREDLTPEQAAQIQLHGVPCMDGSTLPVLLDRLQEIYTGDVRVMVVSDLLPEVSRREAEVMWLMSGWVAYQPVDGMARRPPFEGRVWVVVKQYGCGHLLPLIYGRWHSREQGLQPAIQAHMEMFSERPTVLCRHCQQQPETLPQA